MNLQSPKQNRADPVRLRTFRAIAASPWRGGADPISQKQVVKEQFCGLRVEPY